MSGCVHEDEQVGNESNGAERTEQVGRKQPIVREWADTLLTPTFTALPQLLLHITILKVRLSASVSAGNTCTRAWTLV